MRKKKFLLAVEGNWLASYAWLRYRLLLRRLRKGDCVGKEIVIWSDGEEDSNLAKKISKKEGPTVVEELIVKNRP